MTVGLIHDDRFQTHDTGHAHPERPARLASVAKQLQADGLIDKVAMLPFEPASVEQIQRIHDPAYIDHVRQSCVRGVPFLDSPDTPICNVSYDIALLAAGGVLAAVDAVMAGQVDRAFCAVRPPGHHAERDAAMGFCLFNNIAIAAAHLIEHHKLERVAIVDFDVHHGNGTQHVFDERSDVLFVSVHEHPKFQFPGTGFDHETGNGGGAGATLNVSLMPGDGDTAARSAMDDQVLPKLEQFKPQFVLLSAGFDAIEADPLGGLNYTYDTFTWMTRQLLDVADRHSAGRFVSVLEGGYDLQALARCVSEHVAVLLDTM